MQMDQRIDFVIAGTQKGGTTALHGMLSQHPEIQMPARKELHFFNNDSYFAGRSADYSEYHAHFDFQTPPIRLTRGEATPAYMYWEAAPTRMLQYNPDLKIVLLLRNPILRAYSHWNMQFQRGFETFSFLQAIKLEPGRCVDCSNTRTRLRHSYIDRGRYAEQIRRIQAKFPTAQVLILTSASLRQHMADTLSRIHEFLGVVPLDVAEPEHARVGHYSNELSAFEYDMLLRIFQDDIRETEKLTNLDLRAWREPGH